MKWIRDFQLFLFDFDGLLVNTEPLHYQAYINVLAKRRFRWDWSFSQFCAAAHLNSTALKEGICAQFPELDSVWDSVYAEKKEMYLQLVCSGKVDLMSGAERLLRALEESKIRRCVVTHAVARQTEILRSQIPVLKTIPHWITREDYERPKPFPDCYLRAIGLYGKKGDRIIGFEDSIRGLAALRQTPALPVLICPAHHPLLEMAAGDALHYESLAQIPDQKLL